jgi:hypothetical protein
MIQNFGTCLSKEQMKKIVGGRANWCGTCENNPGGDPFNNTVCVSLPDSWQCMNYNGYGGNALGCFNTDTMEYEEYDCQIDV